MAKGRKTGGRKKGSRNKVTADVKALAQAYGPEAIKGIAELAASAETEATRLAAWKELLDRGYGKPSQAITGPGGGPIQTVDLSKLTDDELTRLERIIGKASDA